MQEDIILKIDKVYNEIKRFDVYKEAIVFFEMQNFTFILKEDAEKISKESFPWMHEKGKMGPYLAYRMPIFDPNDIDCQFDDMLYKNYTPIRVKVKPEYWIEDAFTI
jgi:hypothetical protein